MPASGRLRRGRVKRRVGLHDALAPVVGHRAVEGEGRGVAQQGCAVLGLESHEHVVVLQGPGAEPDDAPRLNIGDLARGERLRFQPVHGEDV